MTAQKIQRVWVINRLVLEQEKLFEGAKNHDQENVAACGSGRRFVVTKSNNRECW